METDELPADSAPPSTTETDMKGARTDDAGAENGESGDKAVQMETDAKVSLSKNLSHLSVRFLKVC